MREQPQVVSLEVYRRRRYAQMMQKERAIYLASVLSEMNNQKLKGDIRNGRDEVRKD